MTGYAACCCYGAPTPCFEPFTLEHGGIFEWSFNLFPGILSTHRRKFDVRWSITFDPNKLPSDPSWTLTMTHEEFFEPGQAQAQDYFIKRTLSVMGTRLNDRCLPDSDVGCPQYQPTSDKGLRELRPVLPFLTRIDPSLLPPGFVGDLPDPNTITAGTITGDFEIGGTLDDGSPATLESLFGPPKEIGAGGPYYYEVPTTIWNHHPTPGGGAPIRYIIPFDGPDGTPNPMGTTPFVDPGFATTTPSIAVEVFPIIAYTEDGGQQGGVPTSVHPFQGFPDVPVVLQAFPEVLGSWFCDGDNFPLVNGYQVIQYSGEIGP